MRLLFAALFLCATSFAQRDQAYYRSVVKAHRGDTAEVNALNELFKIVRISDPESAKGYLDRAMKLARKINYNDGQAMSYRLYGIHYSDQGNYEEALKMLKKAKAGFERTNNELGLVSCLNGMANIKMSLGDYPEALEAYLRTAELNESLNNQGGLGKAYHNIGTVHLAMEQYDEALRYFKKSRTAKSAIGDSLGVIVAMNAIGATYGEKGEFRKALNTLFDAERLSSRLDHLLERGNIFNNIGNQYFYKEQLDSTAFYYKKALECYRMMGQKPEIAIQYKNIADLYVTIGDGGMAKAYYDSSLVLAHEMGAKASLLTIYEGLSEANALLGDYKTAYGWYKKYHKLNEKLSGEGVKDNINELQAKFDSGRKDLRIAQLETREAEAEASAANWKMLILIVAFSALTVVIFLLYFINRRKIREKLRFKELEQKALRAQMNPHFIFNSLNSIQRMYIEGREETANDYMADFSRLLRSILENSGRSAISLLEECEITKLYLDLEQLRTDNLFTYAINLDPTINPRETKIPPLILQPYVENAIWHGIIPRNQMGHIGIRIQQVEGNKLRCEITDDGVGYGNSNKGTGFPKSDSKGMEITAERIGGSSHVQIQSGEEGGTKITLIIDRVV